MVWCHCTLSSLYDIGVSRVICVVQLMWPENLHLCSPINIFHISISDQTNLYQHYNYYYFIFIFPRRCDSMRNKIFEPFSFPNRKNLRFSWKCHRHSLICLWTWKTHYHVWPKKKKEREKRTHTNLFLIYIKDTSEWKWIQFLDLRQYIDIWTNFCTIFFLILMTMKQKKNRTNNK